MTCAVVSFLLSKQPPLEQQACLHSSFFACTNLALSLCACRVLQECWAEDSKERPSFEAAHARLAAQLAAARGHLSPSQAARLSRFVIMTRPGLLRGTAPLQGLAMRVAAD